MQQHQDLPLVLAGPLLRRLQPDRLTFWLAVSAPLDCRLTLTPDGEPDRLVSEAEITKATHLLKAGEHCYFFLIDLHLEQPLPLDLWIGYELWLRTSANEEWQPSRQWADQLSYEGRDTPGFVLKKKLHKFLHGSCRKPHYESQDGLLRADQLLADQLLADQLLTDSTGQLQEWPSVLIMSGDQIYADDVAAPMLAAIHQLGQCLEFPNEQLQGAEVASSTELHRHQATYYHREQLLPKTTAGRALSDLLFAGVKKPVFTSDNAHNHLISLAEILGMYLLVWSPVCWKILDLKMPLQLTTEDKLKFQQEKAVIDEFVTSLSAVRRVMAHLPVAMIFDDHDVTDDWNLTAGWEQTVYEHPFSKRIIGNALLGYFICQGWGNAPENFSDEMIGQVRQTLSSPGGDLHDKTIDQLLAFSHWHYQWSMNPALIVLDTRTRRWRSERGLNRPSGLMDWEALTDLQQSVIGKKSVIIVSPAPMFGVKLIETIQRVFTWFGKPLMVDAENWMAHPGSALALLSLFRHSRTPGHFIILSGDVHYSFVYHIKLRGHHGGPDIWQITSSGIRNEFPKILIEIFDRLDRWLYAPGSPLNWFTKRRRMRVTPHKPVPSAMGERLVNASGIGLVELKTDETPRRIAQLCAEGKDVEFELDEKASRWE